MLYGEHKGKRGVVTVAMEARDSHAPYNVTFADGAMSGLLKPDQLQSSGRDQTAFLLDAMGSMSDEVRRLCSKLQGRHALHEVRRRVVKDELPLLSLLQTEPLQLQASHLSFQEYFAAVF